MGAGTAGALVTLAAAFAIGAGGLATAGAAPPEKPAAGSGTVASLAVVNLGLTTTEAKRLQGWLKEHHGYTGAIDGIAGPETRRAFGNFPYYL
ncbi:hypothetical protein F0L17_21125 [Streptomyces sp. TRM43335]|uniref:Peptidoglycan binding-like domain-containing protein n=1 Tax=Streptomyces taklimakanensis TaxID=2569853 RepID=A0A6G2BHM3_9ACTN|nr:hypothetical protein [Streptomyces taklimakanensis]